MAQDLNLDQCLGAGVLLEPVVNRVKRVVNGLEEGQEGVVGRVGRRERRSTRPTKSGLISVIL